MSSGKIKGNKEMSRIRSMKYVKLQKEREMPFTFSYIIYHYFFLKPFSNESGTTHSS